MYYFRALVLGTIVAFVAVSITGAKPENDKKPDEKNAEDKKSDAKTPSVIGQKTAVKLIGQFGGKMPTPEELLRKRKPTLRKAGLSNAKVEFLRDLAQRVKDQGGKPPENLYADLLHCVEPALLAEVMHRVQGNRWVAAQWLGLNRATVRKKLATYGLADAHRPEPGGPRGP